MGGPNHCSLKKWYMHINLADPLKAHKLKDAKWQQPI